MTAKQKQLEYQANMLRPFYETGLQCEPRFKNTASRPVLYIYD